MIPRYGMDPGRQAPTFEPWAGTMIDHALSYAALGLEVFPLRPDKTPYTTHGMTEATADLATVKAWWDAHPDALIGCRVPIDVLILDIDIRHGGSQACYRPSTDHVQMPDFACFRDAAAYYAVLLHECGHASGARHRLDRDLSGRFGSAAYAMEECTVELLSAMICADLHLSVEPRPDHASYIASWLEVLRSDKRAIFTAAAKAQQIADWLHAQQGNACRNDVRGAA